MATTHSLTSKAELNKLPPADSECGVCYQDEDEDDIKLQRCTTCRNQFYCGTACQTKDWKKHKHNCSLLPVNDLEYLAPLDEPQSQQLLAEVQRVASVLHTWEVAFDAKRGEKAFKPPSLPENDLLLKLELSQPYSSASYTRAPPEHQTFKYRTVITLITRLFLIHLMTPSPSRPVEEIDKLQRSIATWQMPSTGGFAQLWAPKIACRPGDLSPGEYSQLAGMMQMLNMEEWFSAGKDDAGKPAQSDDEKAFSRRLVDLTIISKTLWNVK